MHSIDVNEKNRMYVSISTVSLYPGLKGFYPIR